MDGRKTRRRPWTAIAVAALALVSLGAAAVVATAKDRNDDGIPDRWERKHDLSLKHKQGKRDQDSDQLRNRGEFRSAMDPRDSDSDDDGIEDGDEGAGTIASFDSETGKLVINLFNGESVSGTVDDETEIECRSDDAVEPDDEDSPGDSTDRRSREESDGNGEESGEDEPGDDDEPGGEHGDEGEDEHGDDGPDHGEDDCDGAKCSVDDLTEGRVVREASLDATGQGLVYDEIELD